MTIKAKPDYDAVAQAMKQLQDAHASWSRTKEDLRVATQEENRASCALANARTAYEKAVKALADATDRF